MSNAVRPFALSLLIILAALLTGCSIWDSLTSYFNTFYNAERLFDEIEDELWDLPGTRYTGRNFLVVIHTPPQQKVKLTTVIEKCSKILQNSPGSSYVDDALVMIGKSYYYLGEYQRAERKFKELIEGDPGSGLVFEARLMLAYTYYKAGSTDLATETTVTLGRNAREEGEDQIEAKARAILARLDMDAENYESAITHLKAAVELEGNREQRATMYLTLGDLLDQKGDYEDAEDAYDEAASASGIYVNEYRGYLGAARMVAKQEDYDGALEELDELRSDDNYREFFGDIELEMGRVLVAGGDYESAIEMLNYVDTAYARTEVGAKSLFEKGRLYEEDLGWYDSAKVSYDKGRRAFPQAEITTEIVRRADYMARYFVLIRNEQEYDSLRTALLNPVESTDSVEAVVDTASSQADSVSRKTSRPALSLDSVNVLLTNNRSDLGALFFTMINVLDSAKVWYSLVVEESPNSAAAPASFFALAQIYGQDSTAPPGFSDSLHRDIVRQFPGTEFAAESRRILGMPPGMSTTDPEESLYTSAEQRFLNGSYQSAIEGYQAVVERYPESEFAPMAQYAIGYIYENSIGLTDSAVANYEKLIAMYPQSSHATRVRPRIAEVVAVRLAAAREDSIAAARLDSIATAQADSLLAAQPDSLVAQQSDSLAAQQSDSLVATQSDSLAATQSDSLVAQQSDSLAASSPPDTSSAPQEPGPEEEGVAADSTGAPSPGPPGQNQQENPSGEPPRDNRRPR